MNKVIKKYTYDEFGMYANGEPVRPIVCLLLGLLRVPISIILLFVGCVFLPGGIVLMLAGCFLLERAINVLSAVRHYLKARKTFGEFVPKNHLIRNIVIVALTFVFFFLPGLSMNKDSKEKKASADSDMKVSAGTQLRQAPTEQVTEPQTEALTEQITEPPTEPPTPAPTEPPTEPPTPAPTEPPTEPPTPAPTEPPTEPPTPAPTEPPTEIIRQQPQTEQVTEPPTEAPTAQELYVYLTKSGKKYHSIPDCGNTDPNGVRRVPLSEARQKYSPCSKCCSYLYQ